MERTLPSWQVISILRSMCGDVSTLALFWHMMKKYNTPIDNSGKDCDITALEDMFGADMATTVTRLFPSETPVAVSKAKFMNHS